MRKTRTQAGDRIRQWEDLGIEALTELKKLEDALAAAEARAVEAEKRVEELERKLAERDERTNDALCALRRSLLTAFKDACKSLSLDETMKPDEQGGE